MNLPVQPARVTIPSPRPPEVSPPHRIPVFATIAPVIASVVLWLVTRSPYALAFAALGPVVAVASGLDARLQRRRNTRRETARFAHELEGANVAITTAHDVERTGLERRLPAARELFDLLHGAPERWRASLVDELLVRVGIGPVRSTLEFGRDAAPMGSDAGDSGGPLRQLATTAAVVPRAPISRDARHGIGLVGPHALALAAARGAVLQLATALSPESFVVSAPTTGRLWDWLDELPHERVPAAQEGAVTFAACVGSDVEVRAAGVVKGPRAGATHAVIATATIPAELPREIRTVLELDGAGVAHFVRDHGTASRDAPPPDADQVVELEFTAEEEAVRVARALAECARREGVGPRGARLPEFLELSSLLRQGAEHPSAGDLRCVLGKSERGPAELDLVHDGPHAVVGGTTGSGKSELLLSWMLAMAAFRSPAEVTFLFVDFKGGASFDPLLTLPHCVGVITDLDAQEALRALSSLSAELRYRERVLAEHRLRSIDDADGEPPFPRLVVVVDEFAALVEIHSALHPVFVDIASRGRSLGVHLILCTQRPAGVVRESILANCGLRISLRVNSNADSSAVIGTGAAAALPVAPLGRAFTSIAGAPPELVQVARSSMEDVRTVVENWLGSAAPRRPWRPPLPPRIPLTAIRGEPIAADLPFALMDAPEHQSQHIARYDPFLHGSMLVAGGSGSGKTGVLNAVRLAPSSIPRTLVCGGLPGVWDALSDVIDERAGRDGDGAPWSDACSPDIRVLLIDDIDAIAASCPDEYQAALLDLLVRAMREGSSRGVRVVLTAQRIPGILQSAAALCGTRVLLGMPNRQEHILAGGESGEYFPGLTPGAGHWQGHRIQVLSDDATGPGANRDAALLAPPPLKARAIDAAAGSPLAVVSARPERIAAILRAQAPARRVILLDQQPPGSVDAQPVFSAERRILVGDADAWQSHWGAWGALRGRADLLFDACTPLDLRTLARVRELPPPFPRGERSLWLLGTDGRLSRARLVQNPCSP